MKKIRVGVIGVGSISKCHIHAYQKNPDAELCAFCDINEKRLKEMGERYNVTHLYTDKDEMLKQEDLDAVSVCTWNSQHAPCTIAALKAGVNVLCEKPMSVSAKEAENMKKAAEESGKLLMIGFVRRFSNDCKIMEDFIKKDFMGDIYYAKAVRLRRNGNPGGWFGDKSRSGGGPLVDLGVHVIDYVRYLSGNPKAISVYGATFQKLYDRKGAISKPKYLSVCATDHDICDVEDLASALIRFDNGLVLSVEAAFSLNIKENRQTVELFGTKGGAKMSPEIEFYSSQYDYLTNVSLDVPSAPVLDVSFGNEINHFVACVKDGVECKSPAEDGLEIMRILDAVYESAKTGHEVILK